MPREKITRRQKNISRLLREKKQSYNSRLKATDWPKAKKSDKGV